MDKSDLLEEWDVVSVTEAVLNVDSGSTESDIKNKENVEGKDDTNTEIDEAEDKSSGSDTQSEATEREVIGSEAQTYVDESRDYSSVDVNANATTVSADIKREEVTEPETCEEPEQDIVTEPDSTIEVVCNVDSNPERESILDSECSIEPEFGTILTAQPESSTHTFEPEDTVLPSQQCDSTIQSDSSVVTKEVSLKTEISCDSVTEEKAGVDTKQDTADVNTYDDSIVEDIVHVEKPVNNNLDSSLLTSEIRSEEFDTRDTPELVPRRIQIEQEMAALESSSSDIDIIDDIIEESITSSFISPLSLSISSSVADASSIRSFICSSEDSPSSKAKERPSRKSESSERKRPRREVPPRSKDKSESVRDRRTPSPPSRSLFDWFYLFLELLRNMSGYDWCMIGGIAASIYLTIVVNQTNIFAVVQKENVVSQMKEMIDELKNDNKMLKDQMLSELKNKKAISSFEHQIRELRKENSKLSHMLYDVAKVLDKQKYSHEKKESEYLAPFKQEINKLKEHINILKFDNEELQKELVRMRYGSYGQGDPDKSQRKDQPGKKESTPPEEEIPQDFESLKKWNELITLLTQELSSLAGTEGFKNEKSHSKNKNEKPFIETVFTDFKGTFNNLRKINFTALLSEYKKANQRAMSDVYNFVKDFFTVAEHTRQYTSKDDSLQWKNIGDFVSDLKEKWTHIKDRLYTSDLKQFFEKQLQNVAGKSSSARDTEGAVPQEKQPAPDETEWMFNRAAHREELRNVPPKEEEELNWYLKKGKQQPDDPKGKRHL